MECPWENPLFENTDQLMDERYANKIHVPKISTLEL